MSATRSAARAALLVGSLLIAASGAGAESRAARVSGAVELGRGTPPAWRALAAGDTLEPGDAVRTGRDGRAELLLEGSEVRLYGDSLLRLPGAASAAGESGVDLEQGSSLFDVRPGRSAPFEIRSPEVIVSVKGTRFAVDLSQALAEVAVFRGEVGVRSPIAAGADEVLVREGFSAAGSRSAAFELFLHLSEDPWDGWASGAARAPTPRRARVSVAPSERALAAAQHSAGEVSRREAIARTLERRPELAARIAEIGSDAAGSPLGGGAIQDGVLDSRRTDLQRDLTERALESALGLDIAVVAGAIQITDLQQALTTTLSASELLQVSSGQSALPATLTTLLSSQGIQNDEAFAGALLRLLPRP